MCAPLGVDPLVSRRSFWSKTLGVGMGDYYFELAVKIAEVCFATRSKNGGIIAVSEIQEILSRNKKKKVHKGDIPIAVNKLKSLGGGFRIMEIGTTSMIVSVPTELDSDHVQVFSLAESGEGCITTDGIATQLGWNQERADRVMKLLLSEGMAWEDKYHGVSFYWFPSVWKEQRQAELLYNTHALLWAVLLMTSCNIMIERNKNVKCISKLLYCLELFATKLDGFFCDVEKKLAFSVFVADSFHVG